MQGGHQAHCEVGCRRFPCPAMQFFEEEYALDLRIHSFKKPLVVLADGITMGGGLGLAAGSDMVIATERTRMAMPETRIGFFPDGARPDGCSASVRRDIPNSLH